MYLSKLIFRAHFLVASMLVGAALPSISMAQTVSGSAALRGKVARPAPPSSGPRATATRSRETAGEIEQLRTEVDALHALLKEQTQAISTLQKRLDEIQAGVGGPPVRMSPVAGGSPASNATAVVQQAVEEIDSVRDEAFARREPRAPSVLRWNTNAAAAVQPATNAVQPVTNAVQPVTNAVQPPPAVEPSTSAVRSSAQTRRGLLAGWGDDHAFIRNESGSFETDFLGYSQLDFRGYSAGNHPPIHPPNTFIVRRARIAMEGKIDTYFEWRIEGDFADTNSTLLRDFYLNIHRIDEFVMRFGQTREPFSQEEMRSDNFQEFVERSLVNNLAPSRSPGVMAYGKLGDGIFEYQTGAFNGKGLLALNNNGTPDTALRLRFNPWRHSDNFWIKGLIFGGAYSQGRNLNGQSIKGVTPSQITFFQPDTVNGRLYRANGELTWLLGPAALRAEFDQSNQLRENLGPRGTNLPGVLAKGYMVQFSYLLTGENQPDIGTIVPKRNLFDRDADGRTGLGAWQLKFRYDNLQIIDGTPKSNRAHTYYFGPNWYMNKHVRYLLDFGIEQFNHPASALRPGQRYFIVLSEIQLQL
jgi:phosphate-selective porin OprO/OprP